MRRYSDGWLSRHLSSARAGSNDALEDLLERLHPILLRYARSHLSRDPAAADLALDLVQEALIRIATGLERCRADGDDQIVAWALTIVRNLCVDHYRTKTLPTVRFSRLMDDLLEAMQAPERGGRNPPRSRGERILRRVVRQAVHELPRPTRRLLLLRVGRGWTWSEVARDIGLSSDAAKKRFRRARAVLRKDILERIDGLGEQDRTAALRRLRRDEG